MKALLPAMRDYVVRTTRHPLGFIGLNLTTAAGVLLLFFFIASSFGMSENPYIGLVIFFVLPAIFIAGLVMMPIGSYLYKRRVLRTGEAGAFPVYDLNRSDTRNRFLFIGLMTVVNLALLGIVSLRGIEHMESVSFCGETCHPIMKPEFTVYETSPHSRVRCVDCHIGPGASWFVKSKLSGTKQVFVQLAGTWPRPIHTPVENLRPSRDTCEQCHWPEKFHGDKVRVKTHYQEDEANSELKSVVLLKVGGGNPESVFPKGIHWHVLNRVYYKSDAKREFIPYVRVERLDGTVTEYVKTGMETLPDSIASRPLRLMDCIDCHNRPTHIYRLPARALDEAFAAGALPVTIPYLKREALAAIQVEYETPEEGRTAIETHLRNFYASNYPDLATNDKAALDGAIHEVREIWSRYVYPELNIHWGTYPDHIGHQDFTGCFRCHDEEHVSSDGATISQDCSTCHSLLAVEESEPEILKTLFPDEL